MTQVYETCFFSELYNIKTALGDILRFLTMHSPRIRDDELGEFRLIFSELMCNAVIHGNKQDLSKKVKIRVELSGNTVICVISDEGAGFDYASFLNSARANQDLTVDHGRGIYLVHALTDSLSFNVDGNQIRFDKRMRVQG